MKKLLYSLATVLAIAACTPDSASDSGDNNDNPQENSEGNSQENQDDNTQDNPKYKAPQLVDLGLPSGVKWAASDLGSDDPAVPGDYFSWGETEAASSFSDSNRYWENGAATKYSVSLRQGSLVDLKTVLDPEDDAATVGIGKGWRTPTYDDFMELMDNCEVRQTFVGEEPNTQQATVFTSVKNGNSITFLNRGHYDGYRFESTSMYMSSSLVCQDLRGSLNNGIQVLYGSYLQGGNYRTAGMNVRPVYGGSAKGFDWKVKADTNPEVGTTSASIGGEFLFEEDVMKEYKYFVGIFNGKTGDSFTSRKEFARGSKAQFTGLEPGHTYYYAVCYEIKWRQNGYTVVEDGNSEILSFTTGN